MISKRAKSTKAIFLVTDHSSHKMFTRHDVKILAAVTLMNSLFGDIYSQTGVFTMIEFTKYYQISEVTASNIVISVHICTGLTGK